MNATIILGLKILLFSITWHLLDYIILQLALPLYAVASGVPTKVSLIHNFTFILTFFILAFFSLFLFKNEVVLLCHFFTTTFYVFLDKFHDTGNILWSLQVWENEMFGWFSLVFWYLILVTSHFLAYTLYKTFTLITSKYKHLRQ
jgi:hypothetical protein